jgi:DNA polymerase
MADQTAVLSDRNGSIGSDLVFIAEAPGRFGSGRTGIPFSGDKSGDNFETLIDHAGFSRQDIFITNAVLCNPLSEGCNSRPTSREIENCSPYLKSVLELIRPKLVVTLGAVGLDAINRLLNTRFKLSDTVARPQVMEQWTLLPLYHPSPRVANWKRTLSQQKQDYLKIQRLLKKLTSP